MKEATMIYDAFISYASEDLQFATEIALGLDKLGFRVWYDKFIMKVGDNIVRVIDEGLRNSSNGILIISNYYLQKAWPNFETDILLKQCIEQGKRLLPIWHGLRRDDIERWHLGLANIWAAKSELGVDSVVSNLADAMAEGIPTRAVIPDYESPRFKFLQGIGELKLGSKGGPAFTIWEALLHLKDEQYPISIDGHVFLKTELLIATAQILAHDKNKAQQWIQEDEVKIIWQMCCKAGFDPKSFG